MPPQVVLLLLLAAAAARAQPGPLLLNGTITPDGTLHLSNGTSVPVGLTGSGVNAAMAFFLPRPAFPTATSWINSSLLSYLTLDGGVYTVDVAIQVPSLFVLRLSAATLLAAPSAQTAAVIMNATRYSAVTGGPAGRGVVDCRAWTNASGTPDFRGILALDAQFVQVASLSVLRCGAGGTGGIHVRGVPFTYNAEIGPDVEVAFSANRGVWSETNAGLVVHHGRFHDNAADGIDFDAYSSSSVALSNECFNNARHGIFIEQGANQIVASNNSCYNNSGNGIALYNNLAGAWARVPPGHAVLLAAFARATVRGRCPASPPPARPPAPPIALTGGSLQGNFVIGNVLRSNGAEGASWGSDDNGGNGASGPAAEVASCPLPLPNQANTQSHPGCKPARRACRCQHVCGQRPCGQRPRRLWAQRRRQGKRDRGKF